MRKQYFFMGAILVILISAFAFLFATPVTKQSQAGSTKCTKSCECKPVPQTGFFIFDSFSGNL